MARKLLRNIDTKQKVYGMIPLRDFCLYVVPISGPILIILLGMIISGNLKILLIFPLSLIVTINVFLFSEVRFGENGLRLIKNIIFHSKVKKYKKL